MEGATVGLPLHPSYGHRGAPHSSNTHTLKLIVTSSSSYRLPEILLLPFGPPPGLPLGTSP